MATEMSFLENNGFLAAAAVVVVLQETTVQRLLIRQRDPQVRGDAIIRLRRCRDTIKKLRGRQTSLGHRADHLDRVLLEIKKDIQHFDNAGRTDEAPLLSNTTLVSSPLSCGLLTQATIPDQPSPSLIFDDVINFGNEQLEFEVGVSAKWADYNDATYLQYARKLIPPQSINSSLWQPTPSMEVKPALLLQPHTLLPAHIVVIALRIGPRYWKIPQHPKLVMQEAA